MTPSFRSIAGEGAPRLLVWKSALFYVSTQPTTYTETTVVEFGLVPSQRLRLNHLLWVRYGTSPPKDTLAKIVSLADYGGGPIGIDGWTNGVPTNGVTFYVQGWVIDLPMPQRSKETFEPDYLIHELWAQERGTKTEQKWRGWKYKMELDYTRSIEADDMIKMMHALNLSPDDKLVLIPHRDKLKYSHNVRYAGAIEVEPFGYGTGHKGVRLTFVGTENLASFPMPTQGYGFGYGTRYGVQL